MLQRLLSSMVHRFEMKILNVVWDIIKFSKNRRISIELKKQLLML